MTSELKIGDRVNVETNVTQNWQTKYFCKNAFIREIKGDCYLISADEDTVYSKRGNTPLGWLYSRGYLITKI
jgi:hypothetical protein